MKINYTKEQPVDHGCDEFVIRSRPERGVIDLIVKVERDTNTYRFDREDREDIILRINPTILFQPDLIDLSTISADARKVVIATVIVDEIARHVREGEMSLDMDEEHRDRLTDQVQDFLIEVETNEVRVYDADPIEPTDHCSAAEWWRERGDESEMCYGSSEEVE